MKEAAGDGGTATRTATPFPRQPRHRYRACKELGILPKYVDLPDDTDPVAHVLSKNLYRRHLNESQRGMVAANVANLPNGRPASETGPIGPVSCSAARAATMLNVGIGTVKRAKTVRRHGIPELVKAVEQGRVSVAAAAKAAKLPAEEQQSFIATSTKAVVKKSTETKAKPKAAPAATSWPDPAAGARPN